MNEEDLENFYAKAEGCVIIENDYDVFPGYTIYGKEAISRISVGHDNSDNAYCHFYAGNKYYISISKSYYDTEKNILHLYKKL